MSHSFAAEKEEKRKIFCFFSESSRKFGKMAGKHLDIIGFLCYYTYIDNENAILVSFPAASLTNCPTVCRQKFYITWSMVWKQNAISSITLPRR